MRHWSTQVDMKITGNGGLKYCQSEWGKKKKKTFSQVTAVPSQKIRELRDWKGQLFNAGSGESGRHT